MGYVSTRKATWNVPEKKKNEVNHNRGLLVPDFGRQDQGRNIWLMPSALPCKSGNEAEVNSWWQLLVLTYTKLFTRGLP